MQHKNKRYLYAGVLIFVLIFISLMYSQRSLIEDKSQNSMSAEKVQVSSSSSSLSLQVAGKSYKVLLSDTDDLRRKGLSGRASLENDEVMLFVFESEATNFFWMKDMLFNIDMVWLDKNKNVIFIEQNVAPSTYPNAFGPQTDSLYVLEFNAGVVKTGNIKIGDQVTIN